MHTILTVAKFTDTKEIGIRAGGCDDQAPEVEILFTIEGEGGTLEGSRQLERDLDAGLAAYGLTRDAIYNLEQVMHLIPPLRYI